MSKGCHLSALSRDCKHPCMIWVLRDVVFQDVGFKLLVKNPSPISALGVKSPHLQFSRANQLFCSHPTSSKPHPGTPECMILPDSTSSHVSSNAPLYQESASTTPRRERKKTSREGGGCCWPRCRCLDLLDRELFVRFQWEDKIEKLELNNLSWGFPTASSPFRQL